MRRNGIEQKENGIDGKGILEPVELEGHRVVVKGTGSPVKRGLT